MPFSEGTPKNAADCRPYSYIHGPFLFGTTEKLAEATRHLGHFNDVVILHALECLSERLHKSGKAMLLCGARDQPSQLLSRSDFLEKVGPENVLPNIQAALRRAREIQSDFAGIGHELVLELGHRPL